MEQDPLEILDAVRTCAAEAINKLNQIIPNIYSKSDIAAVGITNQRETVVVWDKSTGKPLYNAIGEHPEFENSVLLILFTIERRNAFEEIV